ncbi:MAG: hypothetical protein EYC70_05310 [Planctomycetota bacterium]|nr:MAG: hypothetical protein EYC70_05310 [Planctomycetota bacterium]
MVQHARARGAVQAWLAEVERAAWRGPQDVRARFPRASTLDQNRWCFASARTPSTTAGSASSRHAASPHPHRRRAPAGPRRAGAADGPQSTAGQPGG